MSEKLKRPQQVTMAAVVAGSASAVMLISIGDRLSKWNTVDVRDGFAETLAKDDLGQRLGLSLGQAMSLARVGLFVAAALAAAVVVLVVFAARRDNGARIALSVVAGPLLLAGLLVDAFLAGFVVAGTVLLWSEPARDWYAGRAPRERPSPPAVPAARTGTGPDGGSDRPQGQPAPDSTAPTGPSAPPPVPPSPAAPTGDGPAPWTGAYGTPPSTLAAAAGHPSGPPARPLQVLLACLTTWLVSGLVAVFTLVSLLGTLAAGPGGEVRDAVERALVDSGQRQAMRAAGITVDQLVLMAQVVLGVVLVWALVAVVLAVLAFAGHGWARVTLMVSSGLAALLGLLGALGALPLLLVSAASVFTLSRLLSRPAAQWYAARR